MHFRLFRPMKRKGTVNHQFNQRIPADIKALAVGMNLVIPIGEGTAVFKVPTHGCRKALLANGRPSRVKERQAQIAAYLETAWQALRSDAPVVFQHRQATALAREFYAAKPHWDQLDPG